MRVDRRRSAENAPFDELRRGMLVRLDPVPEGGSLVRVDQQTRVEAEDPAALPVI